MTLQTWLIISAIIGLVIGLTSIFAPQSMLKPFGLRLEGKASVHFSQVAGAGILSLALVNWVARNYTTDLPHPGREEFGIRAEDRVK